MQFQREDGTTVEIAYSYRLTPEAIDEFIIGLQMVRSQPPGAAAFVMRKHTYVGDSTEPVTQFVLVEMIPND
jgi:hypothetical protein